MENALEKSIYPTHVFNLNDLSFIIHFLKCSTQNTAQIFVDFLFIIISYHYFSRPFFCLFLLSAFLSPQINPITNQNPPYFLIYSSSNSFVKQIVTNIYCTRKRKEKDNYPIRSVHQFYQIRFLLLFFSFSFTFSCFL